MREFGITAPRSILRGLRAFPSPLPGEEECFECHNLVPSEHALRGHETLVAIGITNPFIEYIGVRDQGGTIWYWTLGAGLGITYNTVVPIVSGYGFAAVNVTPAIVPYWIQVDAADVPATQLYIFPAEFSGDILVNTVSPPTGPGYDAGIGLDLRGLSGWRNRLAALNTLDHFVRRLGD